ncbi:hypothetical protein TRFO_09586 [Tritrichomonas foetus]|uniref:BEACH domain-containing protein n=1 Tax=Tritrichomonas foetus TaxID=1144522 RepID=A0A1J4JDM1_9EUKA|nr:hypothetical protein TRFO_09586 [Tritrichomonas foetus]|eukprot:OHS97294.1 hypothetical protein TRFO_09586 [Tritrichomonas foetus]
MLDEFEKSINHLFKLRNDQTRWSKYPEDSPEILKLQQIPACEWKQLLSFTNDLRGNHNITSALTKIGYNYPYNEKVLIELIDNRSDESDIPIIIACFQLLSLVFMPQNDHPEITTNDFGLFMQILNFSSFENIESEINFLFVFLMKTVLNNKTDSFKWTRDLISQVFTHFYQNRSLPSSCFQLLIEFANIAVNEDKENQFEHSQSFISLINKFFEQNRQIIYHINNFDTLFPLLEPLIIKLDRSALYTLCEISKRSASSVTNIQSLIESLVSTFYEKSKQIKFNRPIPKSNIQQSSKSELAKNQTECNSEVSTFRLQFNEEEKAIFNEKLDNFPIELNQNEFIIFDQISSDIKEMISIYNELFYNLDHKFVIYFFDEFSKFNKKQINRFLEFYAAFLLLLNNTDRKYFSRYVPILFNDLIFDPEQTIFIDNSINPLINDFRSSIIDLIKDSDELLLLLLEKLKTNAYLTTETLGRFIFSIDFSKISHQTIEKLLLITSDTSLTLKKMKAEKCPRNLITKIIFYFIQNQNSFYLCLTLRQFVDCLLVFVFEKGLTHLFLNAIHSGLLLITKANKISPVNYLVESLFNISQEFKELSLPIYKIVLSTIRYVPKLKKVYDRFLIPILKIVDSKELMNKAFYLLSVYSQRRFFSMDPKLFHILIEKSQYISYINLLNLIGGTFSLSGTTMFLFKRPCFLPLMFITFGESEIMNDFIPYLKKLCIFSDYNRRALHDGKVDYILLASIYHESAIINGYRFKVNIDQKIAWEILNMIVLSKSSKGFVDEIVNKMITKNDSVTIKKFASIVNKSTNEPQPSFEIGNLHSFCKTTDLDSSVFKGNFTISFDIKLDLPLVNPSTSQVLIMSAVDRSKRRLSLAIINHSLYAAYDIGKSSTIVPLCQRLNPNEWTSFSCLFHCKDDVYSIITFKNFERLHDSEFCQVKLDPGSITLVLGGYVYDGRKPLNFFECCAKLANLTIFNRIPKSDELINNVLRSEDAPRDYVFSMRAFENVKLEARKAQYTFNGKKLKVIFFKNRYETTRVENFISEYGMKLIENFENYKPEVIPYIISLIKHAVCDITNTLIPIEFSNVLLSLPQEKLSYALFDGLLDLTFDIKNIESRILWLEKIIFNYCIWEKSNDFYDILRSWSEHVNNLVYFFTRKSYFSYLLKCFNNHICVEKYREVLISFISRISALNLSQNDCYLLFSALSKSENKIEYLNLIYYIAKSIKKSGYKRFNSICNLLDNNDVNVILSTILTLIELYDQECHLKAYQIALKIKFSNKLFELLENSLPENPNLFPIICILSLNHNIKLTKYPIVNEINNTKDDQKPQKLIDQFDSWFIFPLLLCFSSNENNRPNSAKILEFIAENAVKGPHLKLIINTAILFSTLIKISNSTSENNPLNILLGLMIEKVVQLKIPNQKTIFTVFFYSVSLLFYHLNGVRYNEEIALSNPDNCNNSQISFEKIMITKVNDLIHMKFKILSSLTFNYHVDIKNGEISEIFLLGNALSLYGFIINYQLKGIKNSKPIIQLGGLNNGQPLFTMNDFYESLLYLQSKNRHESIKFSLFEKMGHIFDWMKQRITEKFKKECEVIHKIINSLFEEIQISEVSKTVFQSLAKREDSSSKFNLPKNKKQLLQILGYNYCPFLLGTPQLSYFASNPVNSSTTEYLVKYDRIIPISLKFLAEGLEIQDKLIKYQTLKFIFTMKVDLVLLITNSGESFLISFDQNSNNSFIQKIKKQQLNPDCFIASTSEATTKWIQTILSDWQNSIMTTFDFLCLLNLMSGRTFFEKDNYPLFPSLLYLESSTSCKITYSDPEIFYLKEKYPDAYQNRSKLESSDANVIEFIKTAFSSIFNNSPPTKRIPYILQFAKNQTLSHETNGIFNAQQSILINTLNTPLNNALINQSNGNSSDDSNKMCKKIVFFARVRVPDRQRIIFCYVFNNGRISFFECIFDTQGNLKLDLISLYNLEFIKIMQFASVEDGIIAHDLQNIWYYTVDKKNVKEKAGVYFEQFLFGDSVDVLMKDPSTVFIPLSGSTYTVNGKVTCLTSKKKFGIFVVGTDAGKVIIRTLASGFKSISKITPSNHKSTHKPSSPIAPTLESQTTEKLIDNDNNQQIMEIPVSLLISDLNGFVCVSYLSRKLIISSINGTILNEIDEFASIKKWYAFNTEATDFIAFVDEEKNSLKYFKIEEPEKVIHVANVPNMKLDFAFDRRRDCFIVAIANGDVLVFQRPTL